MYQAKKFFYKIHELRHPPIVHLNTDGVPKEISRVIAYIDSSKAKIEIVENKIKICLGEGSLKVLFIAETENSERTNEKGKFPEEYIVAYLTMDENWESCFGNKDFSFKKTPIFRWEKKLILKDTNTEANQNNYRKDEISLIRLLFYLDKFEVIERDLSDKQSKKSFDFSFVYDGFWISFYMEPTNDENGYISNLDKLTRDFINTKIEGSPENLGSGSSGNENLSLNIYVQNNIISGKEVLILGSVVYIVFLSVLGLGFN